MLTTASLDAVAESPPLLVGNLAQHRRGRIPGRPCLQVIAHCPACRTTHTFGWPDRFRFDAAIHVEAPCPKGPWAGGRIAVGLDPAPPRMAEHRRIAADHLARLRRFGIEMCLRDRLSADRAHEREWDLTR